MTKKQKIWLCVFLAMFIIPELLWSPILNFAYSIVQNSNNPTILRPTFISNSDYRGWAIIVILLETIGLLFSTIIVVKEEGIRSKFIKTISVIILSIFVLVSFLVLLILFTTRNISFP